MVSCLGGIFPKTKSFRSKAQGPKISRFEPGPKAQLNFKGPHEAQPPWGRRQGGALLFSIGSLISFFFGPLGLGPWSEATYLWALGLGAKRLNFGKYAPEVGDHFLLLKVSEKLHFFAVPDMAENHDFR